MTKDEIIKAAASKLMGWKLPQGFCPDAYITFDRVRAAANNCTPTGTNLLHLGQALEMFEYCLGEVLATEIAAAEKRGAEQREAELMAVGMEPVASHTEKGFSQDAGLIWEETNLYSAEQLASARLQGAEEERKKWQDNLHANVEYCPTCCKGKIASPDMTRDEVIFH